MTDPIVTRVTFHFDPACPWTWRTSRWVVDVTTRRSVPLSFRPFELSDGGSLDDVPEQYRGGAVASRQFLRAVEAAHRAGDDAMVGAAYAAYGTAVFDEGEEASPDLARRVFEEHGRPEHVKALTDESFDAGVAESRAEAQRFSGDDTGSPVLVLTFDDDGDDERGFFGPVVAPTPTGDEADRLWDAVVAAARVPQLFELKRRRTASPV